MTNSFIEDFIDDVSFRTDVKEKKTPTKHEKTKYPCVNCAGTGIYRGPRRAGSDDTCFSCGGRGYHLQHPDVRRRANAKRRATMQRNLEEKYDAFKEEHGNLLTHMIANQNWNDFYKSLINQLNERGSLSDNQIAAAYRSMAKIIQKQEERQKERDAAAPDVGDVSRIRKMFDDALAAGKKRRALLAAHYERTEDGELIHDDEGHAVVLDTIKLTPARAPRTEIWVTINDGNFVGGIDEYGKFKAKYGCPEWVTEELVRLAKDPETQTRLYGQVTGQCCCCGRELTNANSIAAGIGPICAENWGV